MQKRRILVTAGLPYANGPIHAGHLLEYIQADIYVRFMRLLGHEVHYICGDDTHGTAVMLSSQKAGVDPEAWIGRMHEEHLRDLSAFGVEFSHYGSTHSETNRKFSERVYLSAKEKGLIFKREVSQLYDPKMGLFLSDRQVKGGCPKCRSEGQYGDSCEVCGSTYSAQELLNPVSVYGTEQLELRQSEHLFFDLLQLQETLSSWLSSAPLQVSVRHKLSEWMNSGLLPWDISRDAPYFGFEIPGEPNRYFYVWVDAPLGYLSAFLESLEKDDPASAEAVFREFWEEPETGRTEVYHFIGKDITYFHGLFWPALLSSAGLRLPNAIHAHGFLTLNGRKMSKSRGTFIEAQTLATRVKSDAVRYYFAAHLDGSADDMDFNFAHFVDLINADLVNRLVNIASRTARLLERHNEGRLGAQSFPVLIEKVLAARGEIEALYEVRNTAKVVRLVGALCDEVNAYLSQEAPWQAFKEGRSEAGVLAASTALEAFSYLVNYLAPIVPELAGSGLSLFGEGPNWRFERPKRLARPFSALFERVSPEAFEGLSDG